MTTKTKRIDQAQELFEKFPRKNISCQSGPSIDERGTAYAELITSPELAAYRIIGMMQPKKLQEEIDAPTLLETLRKQGEAVQHGEMAQTEAMLMNQATALQALFVRLSEKAMEQTHMPNLEGFMRMALRAQSQCRATLETLSAVKNPPVVYAKQANVTTGPQQINNGMPIPTHTGKSKKSQNKLIKGQDDGEMDTRGTRAAIGVDPAMETMGAVDRADNSAGQEGCFSK